VEAILPYETFNTLPHHVPAFDVGVVDAQTELVSLREVHDFFYVTGYAHGEPYFKDLERIAASGRLEPRDLSRADALADALVTFHGDKKDAPELYRRRLRDLFGHHECIAGLLDSYDGVDLAGFASLEELREIERRGLAWRHRLKPYTHRLCRVHGDYHPWNILFDAHDHLTLLDRSRGEWGEAADDLACITINYLFFSLRAFPSRTLVGPFEALWQRFFERYLAATGDSAIAELLPPYYVWRALVVASPVWYPDLPVAVRRSLFRFIHRVQALSRFEWRDVNALLVE
jgi:aminoglycoside phosphotransferase (APT) family kinase protein